MIAIPLLRPHLPRHQHLKTVRLLTLLAWNGQKLRDRRPQFLQKRSTSRSSCLKASELTKNCLLRSQSLTLSPLAFAAVYTPRTLTLRTVFASNGKHLMELELMHSKYRLYFIFFSSSPHFSIYGFHVTFSRHSVLCLPNYACLRPGFVLNGIYMIESADPHFPSYRLEAPILFQPDSDFQSVDALSVTPEAWAEWPLSSVEGLPVECAVRIRKSYVSVIGSHIFHSFHSFLQFRLARSLCRTLLLSIVDLWYPTM